ncbi:MAG: AAA family ATPase [Phycisphaerae bacterium]
MTRLDEEIDAAFRGDGKQRVDTRPTIPVSRFPIGKNEKREIRLRLTSVADLLAEPVEETDWIVDGLLPVGGLSILAGKPKAGKSTLARCIALSVARGESVLGRSTVACPVIYLGHEDRRRDTTEHLRAMGARSESLFVHTGPAPADAAEAVAQLEALIREHAARFVVIDTLLRFVRARDVSAYAEMTVLLDPLLYLSRRAGCHVMAVYHAGKLEREGLDGILGSVGIAGTCDTGMILKRRNGTRTLYSVQRTGTDLPETVLTLDPGTRLVGIGGAVAEQEAAALDDSIVDAIRTGSEDETEIRAAVGGNTAATGRRLRDLLRAGRLTRTGHGRKNDPFQYSFPVPPLEETRNEKEPDGLIGPTGAGAVDGVDWPMRGD